MNKNMDIACVKMFSDEKNLAQNVTFQNGMLMNP